jgi:hypothetical protein
MPGLLRWPPSPSYSGLLRLYGQVRREAEIKETEMREEWLLELV